MLIYLFIFLQTTPPQIQTPEAKVCKKLHFGSPKLIVGGYVFQKHWEQQTYFENMNSVGKCAFSEPGKEKKKFSDWDIGYSTCRIFLP